jgi:excisionase family DNA binding protein
MKNALWRPEREHQGIKLHPIPETAELLGGCSEMHVYRLIAAGELRAVDIATPGARRSKTRVRSDDLADYINRNTRSRA